MGQNSMGVGIYPTKFGQGEREKLKFCRPYFLNRLVILGNVVKEAGKASHLRRGRTCVHTSDLIKEKVQNQVSWMAWRVVNTETEPLAGSSTTAK